jgi:hypothetical protein
MIGKPGASSAEEKSFHSWAEQPAPEYSALS